MRGSPASNPLREAVRVGVLAADDGRRRTGRAHMADPPEPAPQGPRPQLSGKRLPTAWNAAIRQYWPPEFLNKQILRGDPVWGGVCRDNRVPETGLPQLDLGLCAAARPF